MEKVRDDKTVIVSSKGQIVIPAKVREQLGIHEGDKLVLRTVDGKLHFEPLKTVLKKNHPDFMKRLEALAQSVSESWTGKENSVELIQELREE